MLSSTAWHQLTTPAGPSPYIAGSWLLVGGQTAPSVLDRGHLPTCPTSLFAVNHAHQCAWSATLHLNIDLSLTVLRTSPDKYHNIYGLVQSHPECTPNTCKYLNCYTCMMDEYTFKWFPTSLQCIPPLNMSMSHSQYLLFRNSGIVNTGISELSLCISMGVRHTVWPINLVNKGVNNKLIPLFFLLQGTPMNINRPVHQASGGTWRAYSTQRVKKR